MAHTDVTLLLEAAGSGDRQAVERLYRVVYDELHRMARANMRREGRADTLQPTALINEAFLRLAPNGAVWQNRRHFFGAAAEAMRRVLVEQARRRHAQKRGSDAVRVTLTGLEIPIPEDDADVLLVDAALTELAAGRPRLAELVTLRFFAGLSIEEAAEALGISVATAKRDWVYARAWLQERLSAGA